jgi:hypothetical protein
MAERIIMRHTVVHPKRVLAGLMAYGAVIACTLGPAAAQPSPYPDISDYKSAVAPKRFSVIDEYGVWFTTPIGGMNCAIAEDGSYGCSGALRGAPAGDNEIAWYLGDPTPRLYHTDNPKFDSGTAQSIVMPRTVVAYRGSRCAVTVDGSLYCINGNNADSQMMITGDMTYRGSQALPAS